MGIVNKCKIVFTSMFCLLAVAENGHCQTVFSKMMERYKSLNYSRKISYDYKMIMIDTKKGVVTDSIVGKLYKDNTNYLDSSSLGITSVSGNYFCKVVYRQRSVTIYNVKEMEKKFHISGTNAPAPIVNISDSMITKYAKVTVDSSDANVDRIQFVFTGQQFSKVIMEVRKPGYTLLSLRFESMGRQQGANVTKYKSITMLYNIRFDVDGSEFDLSRVFSTRENKISLNGQYAHFKVKTLTN